MTPTTDAPRVLDRPLTRAEVRDRLTAENRLIVVLALPLGQIACSSEDGTYGGLNDLVEGLIFAPDNWMGFSDISYKAVGFRPATQTESTGDVLVEVTAEVDDHD